MQSAVGLDLPRWHHHRHLHCDRHVGQYRELYIYRDGWDVHHFLPGKCANRQFSDFVWCACLLSFADNIRELWPGQLHSGIRVVFQRGHRDGHLHYRRRPELFVHCYSRGQHSTARILSAKHLDDNIARTVNGGG